MKMSHKIYLYTVEFRKLGSPDNSATGWQAEKQQPVFAKLAS